ncbi:putative transferase CAF17 homolog, mitochondrial [Nymphalis io]|uniref:putative transferase CAF17 homolog, mitochondrial n=1 Tax=Inachis io TaxID=171585 RepID=UPI002169B625|nr:putative transferase CAF17 homolog, mitochondrial [Nymphalis io]XP_050354207.1 putative transferase CAF17 homolog, mitochondrial [Nymphalis io]XP_050354208.1 putative transferase CAF17 homolog, mitochondrial [Nymphalis io]
MIFNQVKRILNNRYVIYQFLRNVHNEAPAKVLYPLKSRALLKISGQESSSFLQGLITNDMKHFEEGAKSMYAMFLNNKGRVMYDTLIHKWDNEETFLIECDKKLVNLLQKHLKIFKLKRKIEIEDVDKSLIMWALILPDSDKIPDSTSNVNIYKDPRLADLGFRIISSVATTDSQILEMFGKNIVAKDTEEGYKYLRYKLGVSEGAEELPPGACFPLEVNCDYLHGVSFHKGCYIGQEVTARVHHTGVVRKRIMPIKFNQSIHENIEKDSVISASDKPKSNLGKLKGVMDDYGIGLIRIKEALDAKVLMVSKYSAEVLKPSWWPIEAPKEIIKSE